MENRALLSAASFVINEIHADPDGTNGDANGDGAVDAQGDEFVELVNNSALAIDIGGYTLSDGFAQRHTFPSPTIIPAGGAVVVFGGGTPTGDFGGAVIQTASGGSLGLNNGGDTITLSDGISSLSETYGADANNNQAITRNPDITGSFVQHSTLGAALFSPGFENDTVTPFATVDRSIDIVIDYRFDTANFFDPNTADGQAAREILEAAAGVLESRIFDALSAIEPGGGNTWTAFFSNPATGSTDNIVDLEIPENEILIFAGARELGGSTLGRGGPGGLSGMGSSDFIGDLFRDQPTAGDATTANRMDFGPWGGSITFDTSTNWHFGEDAPGGGMFDFFSVAIHELGHVMGVGTADSWRNLITGGVFTGAAAVADQGGNVPVTSDSGHWAVGTDSSLLGVAGSSQEASMSPSIGSGTRKLFTELDFAGLDDLGWDVTLPQPPILIDIESDDSTSVTEGGDTDTLVISLARYANADVNVTLTPSNAQIDLGSGAGVAHVVTFTPASGTLSKTVTVTAVDDADVEGLHSSEITYTVASADAAFDGLTSLSVDVSIQDNDNGPSVLNSLVFNEILPDPNSGTNNFDTDGDGTAETADEFVEIFNTSTSVIDVGGLQFWDQGNGLFFTIPAGTMLGANGYLVVVSDVTGGALPSVDSGSFAFVDDGGMSLSNGGDSVALFDPNSSEYLQATYNGFSPPDLTAFSGFSGAATRLGSNLAFGNDTDGVSLALSPDGDITNPVAHNTIGDGTILATPGASNTAPAAAAPSFEIVATNAVQLEGTGTNTEFTFTVTRNGDTTGTDTVDFAVTGSGTDPADASDFDPAGLPSGTLTFNPTDTSIVVTITVSGDADIENDEEFTVTLSNPSAGTSITTATAAGTIQNDDAAAPEFAIAATDAVKPEGDSGLTAFTFTVTRSANTAGADTIDFAVTAGATDPAAGSDFDGGNFPTGTVNFADGESTQTITINVTGDIDSEPDESFVVTISNASRGTIDPATADGLIQDDDSPSVLNSLVFNEILPDPNSGTNNFDTDGDGTAETADEFVEIFNTSTSVIDVGGLQFWDQGNGLFFTIPAGTMLGANGYLVVVSDVTGGALPSVDSGSFAFVDDGGMSLSNGGDSVALFDPVSEEYLQATYNGFSPPDLTAFSGFSGAATRLGSNLAFGNDTDGVSLALSPDGDITNPVAHNTIGDGTILATPGASNTAPAAAAPSFEIVATNAVQLEGTGTNTEFTFTVTRNGDTTGTDTVDFAVTGSGTDPADASDFDPAGLPSGTLTFNPTDTSIVVTITVSGDADIENDEEFTVTLSNPSAGTSITTATAAGTIQNDDAAAPEFAIAATDAVKPEGDSGLTAFTFTVTRSANTAGADTIDFAVTAGATDPAAGSDFDGGNFPTGTVNFADGESTQTITINVTGDIDSEPDESFVVTISNASRGTIDPATADGLIQDDDSPSVLNSLVFNEILPDPNSGTNNFDTDGDGTAETTDEFVEIFNTTTSVIDVGGLQFWDQGNGLFFTIPAGTMLGANGYLVVVSDVTGGALPSVDSGSFAFVDDGGMSLSNGGDSVALFDPVSEEYLQATYNGFSPPDLTAFSGFSGAATRLGSNLAFGNDTDGVSLALSPDGDITNPVAHNTIGDGTILATPGASNTAPAAAAPSFEIVATNAVQLEGTGTNTEFTFTVTRNGDTTGTDTVDFAVTGSGTDPADASDFDPAGLPSGTLTFNPTDTSIVVTITVSGDADIENDEEFTVTLSNPSAGTSITTATAAGTIQNDDSAPDAITVTITEASVSENGGTSAGTVTIPSAAVGDLVITLASDDTSEATVPTSVTIADGQTSASFTVTAVDDALLDGTQTVTVTASATGFTSGDDTLDITDDEFESTELFLNEIMIDPTEASDTSREYIELRGDANGFLPADTYLVLLEGDSSSNPGNIDHVFELGGMQFGANGLLVLLQAGTPYSPDPLANTVTATGSGWGTDFSSRTTDIENGSVTFLLIQSATAPTPDADADDNDDGTLNANSWTIRDGIGNIDGGPSDTAYAAINVSGNGNGLTPAGSLLIDISAQDVGSPYHPDYLARIGNSTGSTAADWVLPEVDGGAPNYTLALGATVPAHLGGAPLNHLGATNTFVPPEALFVTIDADSFSENGGTATATVRRTQADISADLVVTLASSDTTEATVPATVTIPANAATATFTITGVDDALLDGTQTVTVTASSGTFTDGTDTVDVTDDEAQSLVVTPLALTVTEGGSATFDVSLAVEPTADVTVTLAIAGDGDLTLGTTELTFTPTNFGTPQQVTVNAAEDIDLTDGTATVTVSSAGAGDVEVALTEDDNDALSLVVDPGTLTVTEGSSGTLDVSLSHQPDADVTVTLSIGGDGDLTIGSATTLTFTPANFSTVQAVTVNAAEDADTTDGTATLTVASAGLTSVEVPVSESDNDAPASGLLLNEILFNPPSGDSPNEYIELRGTPNGIINPGTYLVNIEGDDADPGDVNEFVDLSGLQFGSNGFLVLVNNGNGYTIDGAAGQAVDVTDGDQENTSNTFLLIESATAPDNNDDIDSNDDGTPDGSVFAGWTILDGIAILDDDDRNGGASDFGEFAYANLIFAENVGTGDLLFAPAGATIVDTGNSVPGYVGRLGDSTGSAAADWVAGEVEGTAPNFNLVAGTTTPFHLGGAPLDHIGSTNAFNPPKTLTVIINEEAISENGGTATGTVLRTDGDISAELVVTLNSDDTTEATVPATVTIPAGQAAVDFTITAVDDTVVDGTQMPTITASAATFADGSDSLDVTDDDVQAFVINPTTLSVDEGSSATFDVSLAFEPTADVVIALSIGGDADLTLGTVELTFTPANFSTPQQVTVNAAEDPDAVNGTATVTLTSAGIVDGEVIINENDNDSQGIVVDPTAIIVDEGASNTFDVTLAAQPTEDVTVTITIDGDTDVTLGTVELTFTPANFNTPQQVTVNAAEDADAADGTATVTLAATGLSSATVDVTEDDNDAQSLVVAPTALTVPEGGSATFDVSLDAQPTADVEVTLSIAGDGDLTIGSTTTLTFTAANFSTPQTVTIDAAEDADTTNGTATVTVASAGLTSIDVALTEDDNDELATGLLLNEILFNPPSSDRPNEYIELRGTPNGIIADGTYLVNIEGDDNDPGDINEFADLSGLQFGSNGFLVLVNNGNGYTIDGAAGQAVDVTDGDQENNSNTFLLIESATAPDNDDDIDDNNDGTPDGSVFAGWTILDGIAILDDDDRDGGGSDNGEFAYASLVFAENVGNGDLLFTPDGAEIVNTPVPAGYVGRIGDSTGSTAADWVAAAIEGTAPNFNLVPGTTVPGHLSGAPLDHIGSTNAFNPPKTLTVIINEEAISENGGTATGTVLRTDGDISAELVVTLNSDDTTEATVPATVTIPAGQAAVDFTITAVDDALDDETQTVNITASAATFADGSDSLDVTDDDVQAFVINPTTLSVDEGSSATFDVSLAFEPTADVVIALSIGGDADLTLGTVELTFTPANFSTPQQVTVNAAEDPDAVNGTATVTLTSAGIVDGEVIINENDNDSQGIVVAPTAIIVDEGASNTFDVTLAAQPTEDITVTITIEGDTDVTLGTVELTFTPANFNTPQQVTVNAAEDADAADGTATVTLAATGLSSATVDVTEDDNDAQSLVVAPTALTVPEGGSATFDVSLDAQPTADVEVTLSIAGDGDLTIGSTTTLTFTAANFSTPQTVTIDAAEDADTTNGTATVTVASAGLTSIDVALTEDDNDELATGLLLNEILFNPPSSDRPNEYIELRGTPNGIIADGTYLVNIEGDDNDPGDINEFADLSGLQFGSNGFLVLVNNGNGYTIDGAAGQAVDVTDGDQENNSNTFLLIESATAPDNDDDIDDNNDGTPDGSVFAGWTILDGIAILDDDDRDGGGSDNGEFAYASLVFAENVGTGDLLFTPDGAEIVNTPVPAGYVGRIGDSTGSTAADWVAAAIEGTAPNFNLVPGTTVPGHLSGAPLDHIGSTNAFNPPKTLRVIINEEAISENGGTATGTVLRTDGDISAELVVTLNSDDTTEATVPATVTIPAGQAAVDFTITAVDDAIIDGTQTAAITASAATFSDGTDDIDVADDETATVSIAATGDGFEAGPVNAQFTVTLSSVAAVDIDVPYTLGGSAISGVDFTPLSGSVTIPAGSLSATIEAEVIDDEVAEIGADTLAVTLLEPVFSGNITVDGTADSAQALILDNDTATISLSTVSVTVDETGTASSATVDVTLDSRPTADVVIAVTSTDAGEAQPDTGLLTFTPDNWNVPQTVTINGQADGVADGVQLANIEFSIDAATAAAEYLTTDDSTFVTTTVNDVDTAPTADIESIVFYNEDAVAERNFSPDQTGQRSIVRRADVVISDLLGVADATAFSLQNVDTTTDVTVTLGGVVQAGGKTIVTLDFSGGSVDAVNGLLDGNYRLQIDGNALGVTGGAQSEDFHRLFGDSDGDRDVDGSDLSNLVGGLYFGATQFNAVFDLNDNDSLFDEIDDFFANFGRSL